MDRNHSRYIAIPSRSNRWPPLRSQGQRPKVKLLTFGDIPGYTTQKHFTGVGRVLIVLLRKLSTPGASSLAHCWNRTNGTLQNHWDIGHIKLDIGQQFGHWSTIWTLGIKLDIGQQLRQSLNNKLNIRQQVGHWLTSWTLNNH